jgi:hypothetical protein
MKGKRALRERKVLFEGKKIPRVKIGKIWRRGHKVFGMISGERELLCEYSFLDEAKLGLRHLAYKLGREASWI